MSDSSEESKRLYTALCCKFGTPEVLKIRREVIDTDERINEIVKSEGSCERYIVGSYREGYREDSSDYDVMMRISGYQVVCELCDFFSYNTENCTLLMECEDIPPGSATLKLTAQSADKIYKSSCILNNYEIKLSSSLFLSNLMNGLSEVFSNMKLFRRHGPCVSVGKKSYRLFNELDFVHSLRCLCWPLIALPWIGRCQEKQWPSEDVLHAIIKEGCCLVPISSQPSDPEREHDWRISFSVAERKLLYVMNHTQFICYGLLKLFLKEIIDEKNSDPCLSSYTMKTILFWVVQNNANLQWRPRNLLKCFWTCIKLLMLFVYKGECPNFFIPENNMFRTKVVGHAQAALFDQLYVLYCKGISCLWSNPTIKKYVEIVDDLVPNEYQKRGYRYRLLLMENVVFLDRSLFNEVCCSLYSLLFLNEGKIGQALPILRKMLNEKLTDYQRVMVEYRLSTVLRRFAWFILNENKETLHNGVQTHSNDEALDMLKEACEIGLASDIIYLALYYYRVREHTQSLICLKKLQDRFSAPYMMYRENVNAANYRLFRKKMATMSTSDRMRTIFFADVELNEYNFIDELMLEEKEASVNDTFEAPLYVMLHMLKFFNHYNQGNTEKAQQSIEDLHDPLLEDDEKLIPKCFRNISWHILGICQQTLGNNEEALCSYKRSLKEEHFCGLQKVTEIRMLGINDTAQGRDNNT